MPVRMHQAVMGCKVDDVYTGPQEEWLVANGYASVVADEDADADSRDAEEIEKTPGAGRPALDVEMAKHPMNPENRKDDGGNPTRSTARNAAAPVVEVEGAQGDVPTPDNLDAATRVTEHPVDDSDSGQPTIGPRAIPTEVSGATQDASGVSQPTPGSGTGMEREHDEGKASEDSES